MPAQRRVRQKLSTQSPPRTDRQLRARPAKAASPAFRTKQAATATSITSTDETHPEQVSPIVHVHTTAQRDLSIPGSNNASAPDNANVHFSSLQQASSSSSSSLSSPSSSSSSQSSGYNPSYWLMKAEPESRIEKGKDVKFSIDDLAACNEPAAWDGVRNYAARNNLRAMKKGDLAFFYHSNCKVPCHLTHGKAQQPGIVGIMEIAEEASIDETAFNPNEPYYDPKSSRQNPKWYLVKVRFVRKLARPIGLAELKMSRLSVSQVKQPEWEFILELENSKEA
ncbi:PUA-like domain-containing protein [Kalaharituber pfeilii]|nr:PUA-like domain-containing protein [Kalaharituber pfeilii]